MTGSSQEDDSACSGCGVNMEVIGPPGPQHAKDCPVIVDAREWDEFAQQRAIDLAMIEYAEAACPDLFPRSMSNALKLSFDDVLAKHHGADLDLDEDVY